MKIGEGEAYAYQLLRYDDRSDIQNMPDKYRKAGDAILRLADSIREERGEPELHEANRVAHRVARAAVEARRAEKEVNPATPKAADVARETPIAERLYRWNRARGEFLMARNEYEKLLGEEARDG